MKIFITLFFILIFSSLSFAFQFQSKVEVLSLNSKISLSLSINDSIKPIISRQLIYHNFSNEIDIYVPTAEKISIISDGVKKLDDYGHYSILLYSFKKDFYDLKIEATFKNGIIQNYLIPIRIKELDIPYVEINGKNGFQNLKLEELKNAELTISINDPFFDNRFEVVSFKLYVDKQSYMIDGKYIDEKTFDIIANSGDGILHFYDVAFRFRNNSGLRICKLQPLKVKIER